jgi:hypothetical protein
VKKIIALVLVLHTIAFAGPHRVIVMPIDGQADPALRKDLGRVVVELAKSDGDVTTADTSFAETAAAVGCEPHTPACADTVLMSLGVDEIVYGSAVSGGGQTTAVISRVEKGQPRRDQTVSIAAGASADSVEPTLRPMFELPAPTPVVVEKSAPPPPPPEAPFFAMRDHKIGVGLIAGGALVFLLGIALWASESSEQSQINNAKTDSPDDVTKLLALEDKAGSYAWEGNLAVVVGLVAGGLGTYFLVRNHTMTVTPIDHATGAAVTIGGRW